MLENTFSLSVLHSFSHLSLTFSCVQGEDDEDEGDADGDEKEYDSDERQEMRERIFKKMEEKKSTDPSEEDRGKRTNRRLITQK